jgi:hypothetical protein
MKFAFAILLILVPSVSVHAEDSKQSIPKNVQELWAGFEELDKSTSELVPNSCTTRGAN